MLQGKTHHVINPDQYSGIFCSDPAGYAKDVQDHIAYGTSGKFVGFIPEIIQGVGGAAELALGYLKIVHEIVRKAGGVCISDEVRIGLTTKEAIFGGFDTQGVINIVTMAKPYGPCPVAL
ncbi:LOW QUALITY PROTEIN: alanine--glyoxylate aminotransferase 2 homolog 1, mitochondrial [Manihot esculenta]|uniref:LOW QUALITY PROTEIN: alanine--glyoxylate aminotransferase 2 homolog 1, mitochondrial n=1 Tax=Manihot esculenta TaxID=3983 RepID=UPI001CC73C60|nr:LOW QUALITY PROTEIN: alanine--glyoxylate aminotransferase 2 homolog 1, mitochondrial [Manihot esculenta]